MPPLVRLSVVLALASPLLGVAGCDDTETACTLIGCTDALYVHVAGPDGPPQPGRYAVSVEADEATQTCAFTVQVGGAVVAESETCRGVSGDEGGVRVMAERVDGPVTIDVARDGARLARLAVRPAYLGQFPNGPDCGEACQAATVRVDVP